MARSFKPGGHVHYKRQVFKGFVTFYTYVTKLSKTE